MQIRNKRNNKSLLGPQEESTQDSLHNILILCSLFFSLSVEVGIERSSVNTEGVGGWSDTAEKIDLFPPHA